MNPFKDILLEQLPVRLTKFLDSLTSDELNELNKIDKHLLSKVYQAGAVFCLDILNELKEAGK